MQKLIEQIKQIEQWAEDRNLIGGSTPQKQLFKLAEEIGELFNGYNKNKLDLIKDSVGDCVVVLTILRKQLNLEETLIDTYFSSDFIYDIPATEFNADEHLGWMLYFIGNVASLVIPDKEDDFCGEDVNLVFYNLMRYCRAKEIDIIECIQLAYDQIKDRKGKMIDGVFVKEEDLENE